MSLTRLGVPPRRPAASASGKPANGFFAGGTEPAGARFIAGITITIAMRAPDLIGATPFA